MALARDALAILFALVPASASALTTIHVATDAELNALLPTKSVVADGLIADFGGAATFEHDIGTTTSAPAPTAQYAWPNGIDVPFDVTHDCTSARLLLGGHSVAYAPVQAPGGQFFIRTRANKAGASIRVNGLALGGTAIGDESYAVYGTNGGLDILCSEGGDLCRSEFQGGANSRRSAASGGPARAARGEPEAHDGNARP